MRVYIDTADAALIPQAHSTGFVYGVTTNPSLLRRAGLHRANLAALARTARTAGLHEIHLQVFSDDADAMMADARALYALDPGSVVVKIPATAAGFRAASQLAHEGVPLTITAVYTVRQVVLAGIVGARYAAVYWGRLRDAGQDAVTVLREMLDTVRAQQMSVRLLVASVRAADDVDILAPLGIPAITLPPAILFALPDAEGTADAVRGFREDLSHL